jgi:hypothetical protein
MHLLCVLALDRFADYVSDQVLHVARRTQTAAHGSSHSICRVCLGPQCYSAADQVHIEFRRTDKACTAQPWSAHARACIRRVAVFPVRRW